MLLANLESLLKSSFSFETPLYIFSSSRGAIFHNNDGVPYRSL
jgi:hypothetical protein